MAKRLSLILVVLLLMVGFSAVTVSAQSGQSPQQHDISVVSVSPGIPYPGQKVIVRVQYASDFYAKHPGKTVTYQVNISQAGGSAAGPSKATCPEDACTFALSADGVSEFAFYAPALKGSYTADAVLTVDDMPGNLSLPVGGLVVNSALPDSLATLFAGLGLFAAVMAIMALGTEVVIEFGKFLLGLKPKVTALQALDELKKELPGHLTQLNVDEDKIKSLNNLFAGVNSALMPLQDAEKVKTQILNLEFKDLYQTLQAMTAVEPTKVTPEVVANFKTGAKKIVGDLVLDLTRRLSIPGAVADQTEKWVFDAIDRIPADAAAEDLQKAPLTIFGALQTAVGDHEPEWTKQWLLDHANEYVALGKQAVLLKAQEDIFGPLLGLGFDPEYVDGMRSDLFDVVNRIGTFVIHDTDIYTESVKNLLIAVENQRNALQSPARKLWRRLRESSLPVWAAALIAGAAWMLVWRAFAWNLPPVSLWFRGAAGVWPLWGEAAMWGLLASAALALLAYGSLFLWAHPKKNPVQAAAIQKAAPARSARAQVALAGAGVGGPSAPVTAFSVGVPTTAAAEGPGTVDPDDEDALPKPVPLQAATLGYFLRYIVERGFNRLMGRGSSMEHAMIYGAPDPGVKMQIDATRPDTLAQTLLEREQKHQDEEISRERMIRVLSLIIGTYLAFKMQIDAASYLNYAIPGVESQINAVNINLGHWLFGPAAHLTVGMLLTGLAASAGSKFWRDMLGRLESTRDQAEQVARLARGANSAINDLSGGRPG